MRTVMLVLVLLALTGCPWQRVKTAPPEIVTVTVKERMPLPTWATDPLVKPLPANGTVAAHLKDEDARGQTIDLANCHRLLLRKLDKGETPDPKECQP